MNIAIVGSRNAGNINLAQELEKRINIMEGDAIVSGGATLDAVNNLLSDKNCFFVVGFDNN